MLIHSMKRKNMETPKSSAQVPERGRSESPADGFRLLRYFTITSLIAFAVVGTVLYFLQAEEESFFEQVQSEQKAFFSKVQSELSAQQEETARNELLAVHEASHVNLTQLLKNILWEPRIAPVIAKAQRLPIEHCRAFATITNENGSKEADARQACFAELGRRIMSLPEFAALDATAYAAMRASTVFKIKVFDLRGITIYSSEHAQIGEDKVGNLGWKTAAGGQAASELTHRDKFSAFEGVVENRDLISSYIPVRARGQDEVVGVFEIYSDVTSLLGRIKDASTKIREVTAANQARVDSVAAENQQKVNSSSRVFLATVGGLLALLYAALLLLVRSGQRIIDAQRRVQEQTALREQQWHREKMGALATMSARVAHELGNPLATIAGLAEDIADRQTEGGAGAKRPRQILEQTQRIADMIRQIADFAGARSEKPELVDLNQMVQAVCNFMSFDSRFGSAHIAFLPDRQLPACVVIPDHLNEVLINLIQSYVEGDTKPDGIGVKTCRDGTDARIDITAQPSHDEQKKQSADSMGALRVESARRRVVAMGGRLEPRADGFTIAFPLAEELQGAVPSA